MITHEGYELVSGWKKKRYDSIIFKNTPSKLFNWAARRTSGVRLHDFNCGLKAYAKDVVKNIEVSGEMHRYIPVWAKNAGFSKREAFDDIGPVYQDLRDYSQEPSCGNPEGKTGILPKKIYQRKLFERYFN